MTKCLVKNFLGTDLFDLLEIPFPIQEHMETIALFLECVRDCGAAVSRGRSWG